MKDISSGLIETLIKKLDKVSSAMEKASVAEYIELYQNPQLNDYKGNERYHK